MELAGATWPQVEATGGRSLLAVPLGSLEQHGPHLPLDTDTRIAVAVASGLAAAPRGRRGGARRRLRGQRRARRVPRHAPASATRSWPTSWSSWCARPAAPSPASCWSARTAGTRTRWQRRAGAARPRATTSWCGVPSRRGWRRARRTDGDLADAGHRSRRRAARVGRARVHRAPRHAAASPARAKGCGRYRPTACWVTPRVRAPRRARRSSAPWSTDLVGQPWPRTGPPGEPRRRRHGSRAGHRRGDRGRARGRRLAGRGRRPLCRRPRARLPARRQVRSRGGGRAPRRGRAHDGGRRPQPIGHAGRGGRGRRPLRRPAGGRRRGRRHQRRPAAVGDAPTRSGTRSSTSTSTGCAISPRRPCRRCSRRRRHARGGWWRWRRRRGCSGCDA